MSNQTTPTLATETAVDVQSRQLWFPDYPCRLDQTRTFRDRANALLRAGRLPRGPFHNHAASGGHDYGYPALQYRSLPHKGQEVAGLWGLGETGIQALEAFTTALFTPGAARQAGLTECFNYSSASHTTRVEITPDYQPYLIRGFALNERQAALWEANPSRRNQDEVLSKALRFAIFGFLNAVGYQVPDRSLQIRVQDVPRGTWQQPPPLLARGDAKGKGSVMMLDVELDLNLDLPDGVGLGIHKAFGWGVLQKVP